jgi:hypothetical protein
VGAIYFLINTAPLSILSLRAFFLVVLCGTMLFRSLFKINIQKSFVSCLLYCFLSIMMDGFTTRLVDKVIPGRVSITRQLTTLVDARVRVATGNPALPPSTGLMPALVRASWNPNSSGFFRHFIETLFTPVRVGIQAKEQIAKINAIATERIALVESLPSGGAPAGSQGTNALAASLTPPPPPVPVAPATASNVAPAKPAATIVTSRLAAGSLAGLSQEDRGLWQEARQKIVVSGIGWSGKQPYAVIGGRMIRPGATVTIMHKKTAYVFEFRGIGLQDACRWEPVLPNAASTGVIVAF